MIPAPYAAIVEYPGGGLVVMWITAVTSGEAMRYAAVQTERDGGRVAAIFAYVTPQQVHAVDGLKF